MNGSQDQEWVAGSKGNIQQLHILPFRNAVEQNEEICYKLTNKRKYAKLHIEEATIVVL